MSIIKVGLGSYTVEIPPGEVGVSNYQGINLSPLISDDFNAAIPSNGWSSSFHYPFFGDQFSSAMHAHPVSMKATESGLHIAHISTPKYIYDSFGEQVKYEFTFPQNHQEKIYGDLNISLDGMNATESVLVDSSDWFIKGRWQDSDSNSQLEMTFGRGSPFIYVERTEGQEDVVISLNAQSQNSIGQPDGKTNTVFEMNDVSGAYVSGELALQLLVNGVAGDAAGTQVGNAVQARISIDHNGDGTFDYIETVPFFPLDGDANNTEVYTTAEDRGAGGNVTGTLSDLNSGTIKVEVWQAFGDGQVAVDIGDVSSLTLPFEGLTDASGNGLTNQFYLGSDNGEPVLNDSPQTTETINLGEVGVDNVVDWDGPGTVWYYDGNVAGVTVNGNHYGIFAPENANLQFVDGEIRSDLAGQDYLSVAALPDNSVETVQYFHQHAYAFVTDSKVTYHQDQNTGEIITDFNLTTELKEAGFSDDALINLYRHQYINSDAQLTDYSYNSARGELKLFEGNHFSTSLEHTGVLPAIPNFMSAAQTQTVYDLLDAEYQNALSSPILVPGEDSYFAGKTIAKFSELAQIADQVGHEAAKVFYVNAVKAELEDWFTATGEEGDKQFFYNAEWDTFQAYPASFESDKQLNDHHFHYGYFLKGAATIAQFDPEWVDDWGGMVDLIIKDVANTDRSDDAYPYLRYFDPYVGHSYASGHAAFAAGNNQESSSEALNFASNLMMWGAQTGNADYQALGAYLYETELTTVQQYWFDLDNAVFPTEYEHPVVGMVWDDGGAYATFFSGAAEMIHGINYLPMSGGSLYLGLDPDYVRTNFEAVVAKNTEQGGGALPDQWVNLMWQYQAFFDPAAAVANYNNGFDSLYEPTFEQGETYVHGYHWVNNFNALGQVQAGVTADTPFFSVFNNDGLLTYAAYNPGDQAITVNFSDGYQLTLEAEEFKAVNDQQSWSSVTGAVPPSEDPQPDPDPVPGPDPVPNPDPVPDPDPDPDPVPDNPDEIFGTNQADVIHGTVNNDVMRGLSGNDVFHANAGDDEVYGGDGNDTLHGITGDDDLYGNAGDDSLYGNEGNDRLQGGLGKDFLVGGAGADIYEYIALEDSTVSQRDFIEQFQQGADKIDLKALDVGFDQLNLSHENGFTYVGIAGTQFSIQIAGVIDLEASDFVLSDTPIVIPPDDTPVDPDPVNPPDDPDPVDPPVDIPSAAIVGTDNDDVLHGTALADEMFGLAGNDVFHAGAGDDVINGGAGNDTLHGITGNDVMRGDTGDDALYGNDGNDILQGGLGADFLVGGAGADIYEYVSLNDSTASQTDFIESFVLGFDQINLSALGISVDDIEITHQGGLTYVGIADTDFSIKLAGTLNLTGDDFGFDGIDIPDNNPVPDPEPNPDPVPPPVNDPNEIIGSAQNEVLSGTLEDDVLNALAGDDQVHGLAGNDVVKGGEGNDSLYGNAGDDQLLGGLGKDFLVGGEGADVYVFEYVAESTGSQADVIEGFESGVDQLDLTAFDTSADQVVITQQNGIFNLSLNDSDFSVDFIATSQLNVDDILF